MLTTFQLPGPPVAHVERQEEIKSGWRTLNPKHVERQGKKQLRSPISWMPVGFWLSATDAKI
jgi:hypothetical protein